MASHRPIFAAGLFAPPTPAAPQPVNAPLEGMVALLRTRLTELSAARGAGGTSWLIEMICQVQRQDELVVWIQPEDGSLYPPDVAAAGVELERLWVVHTPAPTPAAQAALALRAAELLLRSGGVGLIVLDLQHDPPLPTSLAWQGRLLALVRQHDCAVVLLTAHSPTTPSLGPLVGLRLRAQMQQRLRGEVSLAAQVLKHKGPPVAWPWQLRRRGPVGLVL